MKSGISKSIALGIMCGVMLTSVAGAATINIGGDLITKNPLTSAPKGYAYTYGNKKITAKCTVSKSGYNTKSVSESKTIKNDKSQERVETNWVSGPTWKSSGTKFTSKHTGYSYLGAYQTLGYSATYK